MNYSISELSWGMSLTPYNLSDIADMRKAHSGNMAGNPNFDTLLRLLQTRGSVDKIAAYLLGGRSAKENADLAELQMSRFLSSCRLCGNNTMSKIVAKKLYQLFSHVPV